MAGGGPEIPQKCSRFADREDRGFVRRCQDLLGLFFSFPEIAEAVLYLPSPDDTPSLARLSRSGPPELIALDSPPPEVEQVLHRQEALTLPDRHLFPLAGEGQGVLSLHFAPAGTLSPGLARALPALGREFTHILRDHEELSRRRRQEERLHFSARLGEILHAARSLRHLERRLADFLIAEGRFAAVLFRPLLGQTLLDRAYLRTAPGHRHLRARFREEEETHYQEVLDAEMPWRSAASAAHFPPLTVVPLRCRGHFLGTLALFGGDSGEEGASGRQDDRIPWLADQVATALERVTSLEAARDMSRENAHRLREMTLLFRISRAMHSTLRLNELMHLILSSATAAEGGGFERAMLLMINERSGVLQGMLGVTRETAGMVLHSDRDPLAWERPEIGGPVLASQRRTDFNRLVLRQRLSMEEAAGHPVVQAAKRGQVVYVPRSAAVQDSSLDRALGLTSYACAPLIGRNRVLGVLVMDNPTAPRSFPDSRRFVEIFAGLAAQAMENSLLMTRLETAHQSLRETQERMIQGEKMAVLGEMAASVAHELRGPLVLIGGFARRLAREVAAGSPGEGYAKIIAREVKRMEEMLTGILAFSKKHILCLGECRVDEVLDEALQVEREALDQAGIVLVEKIEPDLPVILGDQQKLRQVMVNLLTNARQAMSGTGGELTVQAYPEPFRGDAGVTIEVEDTGGGIPPEVLRNIFNPFFSTKEKGTGLGLSISHRIIEHHQGEFEVHNSARGAVFTVHLPVQGPQPSFH